ncbi:hypothetical protein [Streptomyces sp. NPDC090112]|uniref:hypothetical protein n=1 Tax=Streptomyces sp. NPDC090112 TaxID=3365949 RepID=UPI003825673D
MVRQEPGFDEAWWRRTERAVSFTREVSLRGLPDLLVAEALYALWSRGEKDYMLRPNVCGRSTTGCVQTASLVGVTDAEAMEQATMIRAAQVTLVRLNSMPETERVKDVWDMAVFGHTSTVPFTAITQSVLR